MTEKIFRIIGDAGDNAKAEARQAFEHKLFDHLDSLSDSERAELRKLEYRKTPDQLTLIDFANDETNKLRAKFGLPEYDIPYDNYHIIPPELYKKASGKNGTGAAFFWRQSIILNSDKLNDDLYKFGYVVLHESLHLKGHTAIEVAEREDDGEDGQKITKTKSGLVREGLGVNSAIAKDEEGLMHAHFSGLHEAVVAMFEKKFSYKMLELPVLKKEKDRLSSPEVIKFKREIADKYNIDINEINYVNLDRREWGVFSYRRHREVLDYLCQEIQSQFSDRFSDKDEVLMEFARAHFTGRLIGLAKLIDGTFGPGYFRILGNMSIDDNSAILTLETFRKARIRFRKN